MKTQLHRRWTHAESESVRTPAIQRGTLDWAKRTSSFRRPECAGPVTPSQPLRRLPQPMPVRPATVHTPSEVVLPVETPAPKADITERITRTHEICDRVNRALGILK